MKAKLLFVMISLFLMGCGKELIEPENMQLEGFVTKATSNRTVVLGRWIRTGTNFRTMQVYLSDPLPGSICIIFKINPVKPTGELLNEYVSNPCLLNAGTRFAEVDLPEIVAPWKENGYDESKGDFVDVIKTTSTFLIQIKTVEYEGDNAPLYLNKSIWHVSRKSVIFDSEGWDVNLKYDYGLKNFRYPFDIINGRDGNESGSGAGSGGGGGGGHGPVDPPSFPDPQ